MAAKDKTYKVEITRIYDAPVKAVWDAWTVPEQVAQWWGPRGFTITNKSKDVKPGGRWVYTMHGPDGKDWPNNTLFLEVEKYKRLVYDHGGNEDQPPLFRVTVNFSELKGKTKMEMAMVVETPEALEHIRNVIKTAGGNSTWDRLGEYLEHETTGKDKFLINRSFNIDINTMFNIWTSPEHLSKWMTPKGFSMKFIKVDIKPGGSSFYCMTGDNGAKMYGKAQYQTIQKPDLIVYTQQFADENGNTSRHPMSPTWPESMQTTVKFYEEGPKQTRVALSWEIVGQASAAEKETFNKAKVGMAQGWGGSFELLEEYIDSRSK